MAKERQFHRAEMWFEMAGLLGTVVGMTLAFRHLYRAGQVAPGVLASGIAMGLMTTLCSIAVVCIGLCILNLLGK